MDLCKIPNDWKTSIIKPIAKPNEPSQHLISYRPISLTCAVCKIFEKMVESRLLSILNKYNTVYMFYQHHYAKNSIADQSKKQNCTQFPILI